MPLARRRPATTWTSRAPHPTLSRWLFASQRQLSDALAAQTDDADLDRLVPTNWGEQWPVGRIFTTIINEQTHHGAEISLLRDLYRVRHDLGR
jgi:Protein of unknown function (DUF664)